MKLPERGSGLFVGDSLPGLLFREGVVIAAMPRDEGPLCVASDMAEPWDVRVVHACGATGGGPARSTRQAGGRESATGLHSAAVTATEFRNWGDREHFDRETSPGTGMLLLASARSAVASIRIPCASNPFSPLGDDQRRIHAPSSLVIEYVLPGGEPSPSPPRRVVHACRQRIGGGRGHGSQSQ